MLFEYTDSNSGCYDTEFDKEIKTLRPDWFRIWQLFEKAKSFVHTLHFEKREDWVNYCESGKKPKDIPNDSPSVYEEWSGWGDWLGTGKIANQFLSEHRRQKFITSIESIKDSLPWLPAIVWHYILIQSGLDANNRTAKLLRKYQGGKLSIDQLIKAVLGDDGNDNSDDDGLLTKFVTRPTTAKILKLLGNPLIAGLDEEALEAIMIELESQIWEKVFEDEITKISKLRD